MREAGWSGGGLRLDGSGGGAGDGRRGGWGVARVGSSSEKMKAAPAPPIVDKPFMSQGFANIGAIGASSRNLGVGAVNARRG
jgi:hypothetical protein